MTTDVSRRLNSGEGPSSYAARMTSIDDLVAQLPIHDIATQLGVGDNEAEQAVRQALPALMGGMAANAQDPAGAASLTSALGQHTGAADTVDLAAVDTDDGQKIVRHVFGDNENAVVDQLGGLGGLGGGVFAKLLPMLAPLVMSFLAKNVLGGGDQGGAASSGGDAGGGIGDVLGGILGGGSGGLGALDDVLGGLFGGGSK